ncbi:MAG: YqaE/Pmp3 family membrane protein [Bacteroidetes bacterium]|nr:YqaE/Pmp3 family membrane protein [Bacteroidota bacterium]
MRYFFCIILPPIAVLSTGKLGAFLLSLLLTLLGWLPGVIFAMLVVNKFYADRRHQELITTSRKR